MRAVNYLKNSTGANRENKMANKKPSVFTVNPRGGYRCCNCSLRTQSTNSGNPPRRVNCENGGFLLPFLFSLFAPVEFLR